MASVVALPASVTMDDASVALRAIDAALASSAAGGNLTIDAAALQEVDTAAVALLLQARRLAQARGVAFKLAGAPPKLMALAKLYGVGSLLEGHGAGAGSA